MIYLLDVTLGKRLRLVKKAFMNTYILWTMFIWKKYLQIYFIAIFFRDPAPKDRHCLPQGYDVDFAANLANTYKCRKSSDHRFAWKKRCQTTVALIVSSQHTHVAKSSDFKLQGSFHRKRDSRLTAVPPLAAITVKWNPAAAWCPSNHVIRCQARPCWATPGVFFNAFLENVFPTKPWENHCLFRWVPVITSTSHCPKAVRSRGPSN